MKLSPTTKDVALLLQLFQGGQLKLRPEFQRESVWPRAAKAYLIDTILNERPIPLFFLQRTTSAQSGRPEYAVIDGQQRLRAIFEFLDGRLRLSESKEDSCAKQWQGKRYSALPPEMQQRILNYDLVIQELSGYSDADIRDIFARMNKYVVRLSKQELRHAKKEGKFKEFVERLAKWPFWKNNRVFSDSQLRRMRAAEFAAELVILLIEGPQDKKIAIDLYYLRFKDSFSEGQAVEARLKIYLQWIHDALPNLRTLRFRRSSELYSLVGALDRITKGGSRPLKAPAAARQRLADFEKRTKKKELRGNAATYVLAASKHTDDLGPRSTRIEILESILS